MILSSNVEMGPNATISWGQVSNQPNAAQLGGVMEGSPRLTHITAYGLYTGTISADQIRAGMIDAKYINTTDLAAEKIYQKGSPNNFVRVGGAYGDLELNYNGRSYISIYNGIDYATIKHFGRDCLKFASSDDSTVPMGKWDFSAATVTGVTATFG